MIDRPSHPAVQAPATSPPHARASVFGRMLGVFLIATAWLKLLLPAEAAAVQSAYHLPYWLLTIGIQLTAALLGWPSLGFDGITANP